MNEDGSFIGQYGRKGRGQDSNAQAFATLVQTKMLIKISSKIVTKNSNRYDEHLDLW